MSDTKSGDDNTLSVTPKKTLTLKRPGMEQGTVRQNFSHGRTKQVVVETKKRKFSMPGDKPEPVAAPVFTPKPAVVAATVVVPEAPKAPPPPPAPVERSGMVLNELSRSEMEARRRALEGSKVREVEDRQRAAEDAKRRAEDEERRKRERDESARRQAEEEARLQTEAESRRRAE
ncbi:translation initiation factor IF-2, partial [Mesorhizobium sp. M7A.T.Ca.TU.009.01.1.2]